MANQYIPIDHLAVGMCVVGLDIPWSETPFLHQPLLVRSPTQVAALKQCGVRVVAIDLDQGVFPLEEEDDDPPVLRPVKRTSLNEELDSAKQLRHATRTALSDAISLIQNGDQVPMEPLGRAVDQTIDSLMRNNRALAILLHQKGRGLPLINHAFNMMVMALLIGQQLQYTDKELQTLGLAALLADIGWIKLPSNLFTLRTRYTEEEIGQVRQHVQYSVALLTAAGTDAQVLRVVGEHHERYDGAGYPQRLEGTEIHPMSRILSLVDHFDSAINGYYDVGPIVPTTALSMINKKARYGSHERALVKLLISQIGIYPVSSAVVLDTGECGLVMRVNWRKPLLPRVKLFYNRQRQALVRPFEIDLALPTADGVQRRIKRVIDPTVPCEDPAGVLRFEEE